MNKNHTSSFRGQTKPKIEGLDDAEYFYIPGLNALKILSSNNRKITKTESDESEIQRLLKNESTRLHEEIFSAQKRGDMALFYELSNSWPEKYAIYEKKIRATGYLDRTKLNIVIIEDLATIRSKIIDILPELLGNKYRVEFQEIDNYEDAKTEIEMKHLVSQNLDKTFYILDNNFYSSSRNESVKHNAGLELYNFLLTNPIIRKEFLANITILSSDENIGRKFPEGVNITEGKSIFSSSYIMKISNWIKSIVEK